MRVYLLSLCHFILSFLIGLNLISLIKHTHTHTVTSGNPDAKRLYDDLLSNYNKLVRPVVNVSDALTVRIKLKLSQLIDVNLKNQIMTTNLWVEQSWYDYKLKWEPREYGGVEMLHVPSDHIWRPDIVVSSIIILFIHSRLFLHLPILCSYVRSNFFPKV